MKVIIKNTVGCLVILTLWESKTSVALTVFSIIKIVTRRFAPIHHLQTLIDKHLEKPQNSHLIKLLCNTTLDMLDHFRDNESQNQWMCKD